MYDLQLYLAVIEAVEAGNDPVDIKIAIDTVDDLLPQGILLVLVDHEGSRKALVEEGVEVLEYDFDVILGLEMQPFLRYQNYMVAVLDVLGVYHLAIDHQVFDAAALKSHPQLLLTSR